MTLTISLFFSLSFLFFFTHVDAFNITKMLNQFPEFAAFNDYLSRTGVAFEINSRSVLTIFAFNNNAASILASLPEESIGKVLRAHVVLDYYNVRKLENIYNRTAILTTLFQTTGRAIGQQGHLNVSIMNGGLVAIGSAVEGAPLNANLVKPVLLQPYTISILQVSDVIIPLGVETTITHSSPAPSPMNSLPPSSIPGAAAGATILPPSATPMAARAPTPRKSLTPSPTPIAARAPTPRNPLTPSPTPAAGGSRKSLSPGPSKDQSPPSISAPSGIQPPPPTPPSHSPVNIFDALPIPPSGNKTSSACATIWFRVVATVIVVLTTFVVLL